MDEAREPAGEGEAGQRAVEIGRVGELGDERLGRRELGGERGERLLVPPAQQQVVVGGQLVRDGAADPPVRARDQDDGTGGAGSGMRSSHGIESGTEPG